MKVQFVVDEHGPPAIVRGLRLRVEGIDVVRVQDVGAADGIRARDP